MAKTAGKGEKYFYMKENEPKLAKMFFVKNYRKQGKKIEKKLYISTSFIV